MSVKTSEIWLSSSPQILWRVDRGKCAGPPILAPAFGGPKHGVGMDIMVVFSQIDREDLETTCLAREGSARVR